MEFTFTKAALCAAGLLVIGLALAFRPFLIVLLTTRLRTLPGPKSDSWFSGNLTRIFKAPNSVIHEEYRRTYGATFVYRGFLNSYRLCTFDHRALNHILNTTSIYHKPEVTRKGISRLFGEGLLTAEDDQHRRQRRVMMPAFGNAQLRELTEIFMETSAKLRDIWLSKTAESGSVTLDSLSWLSRATLDIIGKGGFGYDFDALNEHGRPNELNVAFNHVFSTTHSLNTWTILRAFLPFLQVIPNKQERERNAARATMDRIGRQLIEEKKRALAAGEKGAGRDILSLLIQANMDKELPDHMRMSDEEVIGQVPTFLVAGHETTATATTWCLYSLGQQMNVQERLREELFSVDSENPTMDQLNALPYLDAVVRETLRLHAVVPSTVRAAVQNDSIPLSTPYLDRNGRTCSEIKITKGDQIFIPILAANREQDIWGDDCMEFRPERWLNGVPSQALSIPATLAGVATFLSGPHSCIGYRFAIIEMKALLFHLLRTFKIELAVDPNEVEARSTMVTRPMLKSDKSNALPVKLTVFQSST
ncbi:cytochrome P450 [Auriculariales sp. MPI-PUGE-AT-0066]|nr:cytochrome P450 [Auriculariales sp. MPI-PUGE-AT-0066]